MYKRLIFIILLMFLNLGLIHATAVITSIDGKQFALSNFSGKWILINYWASWCQPCLDEISVLNQFYRENKNQVILFAVNYDALPNREQITLIKRFGISYPSLNDPKEALGLGEIQGVPVTFVFNPQGKLIKSLHGSQTISSLREAILNS